MATTLRAWDAPSARAAATVNANHAINGFLARFGQQRKNKQLKRAVRTTAFALKSWEARTVARAAGYENLGRSIQGNAQGLQGLAQQIAAQQAAIQQLNAKYAARQQAYVNGIATAPTREARQAIRHDKRVAGRQYRRAYKTETSVLESMTAQHERGVQGYESQRQRLEGAETRYKRGVKNLKGAQRRHERAVERYNNEYYPVSRGTSW